MNPSLIGLIHPGDRLHQMVIQKRPFFNRSCHILSSIVWGSDSSAPLPLSAPPAGSSGPGGPVLFRPSAHYELVSALVIPGLIPPGRLPPGGHRIPASGGLALAPAVRMIHRIHRHPADLRPASQPPGTAGLTQRHVRLLDISNLSDRRVTVDVHSADLAGRKTQLGPITLFDHQLRRTSR